MRALITCGEQTVRSMAAYIMGLDGIDAREARDMAGIRGLLADGFIPDVIIACSFDGADSGFYYRSFKAHPDLHNVPVLLIAEKGELERQMEWKAAGVTSWITRPFTPEEFLGMVQMMKFKKNAE